MATLAQYNQTGKEFIALAQITRIASGLGGNEFYDTADGSTIDTTVPAGDLTLASDILITRMISLTGPNRLGINRSGTGHILNFFNSGIGSGYNVEIFADGGTVLITPGTTKGGGSGVVRFNTTNTQHNILAGITGTQTFVFAVWRYDGTVTPPGISMGSVSLSEPHVTTSSINPIDVTPPSIGMGTVAMLEPTVTIPPIVIPPREELEWDTLLPYTWNERFVDLMDYVIRKVYSDQGMLEDRVGSLNDIDNVRATYLPYLAERSAALAFTDLFLDEDGDNFLGRQILKNTYNMNKHIGKDRAIDILAQTIGVNHSYVLGQVATDANGRPEADDAGLYTFTVDDSLRYNAIQLTISALANREFQSGFLEYAREAFRRYLPHWLFVMPLRVVHNVNATHYYHTALTTRTVVNAHLV